MPEHPWQFATDMNSDGQFTIGDVGAWFSQTFYMPGDSFYYLVIEYSPGMSRFLEFDASKLHGFGSGLLSLLFWATVVFSIDSALRNQAQRKRAEYQQKRRELGYDD